MNQQLSEEQSLSIINEMIYKGKTNLKEKSAFYLIWGWAVLLAAGIEYIILSVSTSNFHWLSWPICMAGAGLLSMYEGRKQQKNRQYITFTDNAMKYTWIGFILYLLIVLFMSSLIGWAAAYVLIIGLYGLGTFISGGILKFKPLLIGGVLSLALSLLSILMYETFGSFKNILLLLCLSIIVSYLIPAYILRAKKEAYVA